MSIPLLGTRKDKPSPDSMTLTQHLGELRHRLVVCVIAVVVTSLVCVIAYEPILHFLLRPLCSVYATTSHHGAGNGSLLVGNNGTCNLYVTAPLDGLTLRVKIALFGGLVLASPVILFQLWRFVTPGLKASERRYAIPFVLATLSLFALGAWIAWITFPHALGFLRAASGSGISEIISPQKYLNLLLALMAIFGLTFEFPVVLVALELARVLTPQMLSKCRRFSIVVIIF